MTQPPTDFTNLPSALSPEEWPLPSRFMRLGEDTIHYVDTGEGPTFLFVEAGMWSFIWRDVIERLRGSFRCVALDFPGGGGLSSPPRETG